MRASWVDTVQQVLKALRETSSELLRRAARLFVEEGGSADNNLVFGIEEGGPADDDHPTVETLVQIVRFILEKRCIDEDAALKVFGQKESSDEQCGFATAACLPAKHPWVHRFTEPAGEGSGEGKPKLCKGSALFQRKVVRLRDTARSVLKRVIVFEVLCAHYETARPNAGGRPHSPRASMQSDDGVGQDPVEEAAEDLVSKYQDRLVLRGWHPAPLSAALQIM